MYSKIKNVLHELKVYLTLAKLGKRFFKWTRTTQIRLPSGCSDCFQVTHAILLVSSCITLSYTSLPWTTGTTGLYIAMLLKNIGERDVQCYSCLSIFER